MAEQTGIEWCDATFNPWWGCEKVSPGCAHCYADTLATRYGHAGTWGAGHGFRLFGDKHWNEPRRWARTLPGKLGRRPRVFCASMADVFEERPELDEHRTRLFDLIAATPELDWLLLTKRPQFARGWLSRFYDRSHEAFGHAAGASASWPPLSNVWVGVSIENARYTWRADVLREIPAAVRFISAEPLLDSLFPEPRPRGILGRREQSEGGSLADPTAAHGSVRDGAQSGPLAPRVKGPLDLTGIDWVIVGGESGPRARPMHPDWARALRDACLLDGPAFLFKQWGEWSTAEQCGVRNVQMSKHRFQYESRRFAPDGTPYVATEPDLYSYPGMESLLRVGRKNAGRLLDGRTWDEFPSE